MMRRLRIQTIAGWAGMAATTWVQAAAAGPARDPHDAEDVETLRAAAPFALDFLEQGEERAAHGDVAGALTLFQSAAGRAPQNALALRRVCEAETALGDHDAAVSACFRAGTAVLTTSRVGRVSPAQRLAAVRALVSRPGGVTPSDLASALPLAEEAAAKFPDGPWGYAALCDIAEKTGDDEMLQHALEKLERVAPDSGETRQARAAAARLRPGAGVFAGWGLVAAATMATIARAVRDAARRVRPGLAALGVALAVLGIPSVAHADGAAHISKWPIDDANPEKSIPTQEMITKDPLEMGYWIMDLVAKGQFASQRGDHAAAVKYFSVLSKAVPNRAVSYEKMCKEYLLLGDKEHGFPACAAAVSLPGATPSGTV
ncbi:MAG: hypothetical protein FWD17_08495, partial [Polyangiaceae bacterium]|nr:hypothetical protein [Polyangiaceae bacterium]